MSEALINPYPLGELNPTPAQQIVPEINEWRKLSEIRMPEVGLMETSLVTMQDRARYVVRQITPSVVRSEVSVDFSPPLATRVNGFNTLMGLKIAEMGIPVRIIGTDQTHHRNLNHAAKSTHVILNETDKDGVSMPAKSIVIGYSMGAMKGMGMQARAQEYGREIAFSLGIDPCLADPFDYTTQNPIEVGSYFLNETLELGKTYLAELCHENPFVFLKRAHHLLSTAKLSPQFAANVWDKWKMLATGETGVLAADVPLDAAMVLHFFKNSRFNDMDKFEKIFIDHPYVKCIPEPGYHLSAGNKEVVNSVAAKMNICQALIKDKATKAELVANLSGNILPAPGSVKLKVAA